jgi:single-strand DNA-binding protein
MSTLNKVLLIGNVGTVEVKNLTNGNKLVQLSLATSSGYKDSKGEWQNKTEWHRCIFAIPALAERASSIEKGDKIYVEGSISTNAWTTKEGEKKETKEISCSSFSTFSKASSVKSPSAAEAQHVSTGTDKTSLPGDDDIF